MNKLVATTLESKFTLYDLRTQHQTKGFSSLTEKVGGALLLTQQLEVVKCLDLWVVNFI